MNSPCMTPLSRRSTTSKLRFLGDGTGGVKLNCYFSLLSPHYLDPGNPALERENTNFALI